MFGSIRGCIGVTPGHGAASFRYKLDNPDTLRGVRHPSEIARRVCGMMSHALLVVVLVTGLMHLLVAVFAIVFETGVPRHDAHNVPWHSQLLSFLLCS